MYSDGGSLLPFLVVFVWLAALSYLGFRNQKFLTDLFPKSNERDIRRKFEETLVGVGKFSNKLDEVNKRLDLLEQDGTGYIQKVALLRFNPYDDTGGDISFTLALLDKSGNGLVVTSMHGRAGTRVFAKPVILGKSGKYELSNEEKQVIKEALKK